MYMWRAVDSEGEGLEILVQSKRAKAAACFRHCFDVGAWCTPVIESKILISHFDNANGKCKASNQPNQVSALFPSTRLCTTCSTCNGI